VKWKTLTEYVASLRSEYRNKLLSRLSKFQRGGGRITVLEGFARIAPTLAHLWRNVYDQAREYRREILEKDFFENIAAMLGCRSGVVLPEIGGEPVGFMLLFRDDETTTPIFCGLDYSCNKKYAVYFNLFYGVIRECISQRVKDIDLGITTIVPKLELGAEVVNLHMYMKHLNPVLNRFVPRLFELMTPHEVSEMPKVFRDGS
jgi:predicted N-acyltransferase